MGLSPLDIKALIVYNLEAILYSYKFRFLDIMGITMAVAGVGNQRCEFVITV